MDIAPGRCRDENDSVFDAGFGTGYIFMTSDLIFGDDMFLTDDLIDAYWVELEEAPGYFLSNFGHLYNSNRQHFLKPKRMDRSKHLGFCLYRNGKRYYYYLHRLLAKYYIPNPDNLPIVRHLDDDVDNFDLDNLSYGTQRDNIHDAIRNGHAHILTDDDREKSYQRSRTPIIAKNIKTSKATLYISQGAAARALHVHQSNIHKVLSGERSSTSGYVFSYVR